MRMLALTVAAVVALTGAAVAKDKPVSITFDTHDYGFDITINTTEIFPGFSVHVFAAAKPTGSQANTGFAVGGISNVDLGDFANGPFLSLAQQIDATSNCALLFGLQLDDNQKLFTGGKFMKEETCNSKAGKKVKVDETGTYSLGKP